MKKNFNFSHCIVSREFTLSDGTETEKATLTSATVSSVSEKKDSFTVDRDTDNPNIDEYLTIEFSTATDYASTTSDLGDYCMYFPKECFVPDENYKVSENGYKFTFHFFEYKTSL